MRQNFHSTIDGRRVLSEIIYPFAISSPPISLFILIKPPIFTIHLANCDSQLYNGLVLLIEVYHQIMQTANTASGGAR